MRNFQTKSVANLSDDRGVAKRLASAVRVCRDKSYWVPCLVLIAAGIDRLGGGKKSGYLKVLKKGFPELCSQMTPNEFYSKFRNGVLHTFSPKRGYALANNTEVGSEYVANVSLRNSKRQYRSLNIDRLIEDFLALTERVK